MMGDAVLLMFPALIVLIALGIPIAFSMVLVASVFGFIRFEEIGSRPELRSLRVGGRLPDGADLLRWCAVPGGNPVTACAPVRHVLHRSTESFDVADRHREPGRRGARNHDLMEPLSCFP